ncbi:hypothetical protein IED13_27205 [Bosea sp. SSUT16]|uniref:Uncharacterized protein n=1 Tax=Bosea spartocytisi TaxID=2773451 RepID=A0A927I2A9_9HYPH|nr:hypothetical protein [Bosea spartocytisi]MBD3849404.1 hypothetical protein [Bosea spartocytisi]MCT4475005.1 hypothetical protein [Bosea spartocytisi]
MERIIMARVVAGLLYNTETAELIADVARTGGDWNYERTQLFRTKNSRFYLAGEGGAATRWAQRITGDRGYVEGDGVIPLTDAEARLYVERFANHRFDEFFECADA